MTYQEYLASDQWKIVARQAKKRANFRCQLCNAQGELHAHHRSYDRLGDELDADIVVLCAECHRRFHRKGTDALQAWAEEARSDQPMIYNLFIAQANRLIIDGDDVFLEFGSDSDEGLLKHFNGYIVCSKRLRPLRGLQAMGVLVVVSRKEAVDRGFDLCLKSESEM